MMTVKEKLLKLVDEIPEPNIEEVLYYLEHIKKHQGLSSNNKTKSMDEMNIESWDFDIYEEVMGRS